MEHEAGDKVAFVACDVCDADPGRYSCVIPRGDTAIFLGPTGTPGWFSVKLDDGSVYPVRSHEIASA